MVCEDCHSRSSNYEIPLYLSFPSRRLREESRQHSNAAIFLDSCLPARHARACEAGGRRNDSVASLSVQRGYFVIQGYLIKF